MLLVANGVNPLSMRRMISGARAQGVISDSSGERSDK
jgi:hypothetical protein